MIERQTAKKTDIASLTKGTWVKKEGMEPSYIETGHGERVSRARILGTIVGKFVAEDGNFASVTLDDHTDTLRLKTFKTTKPLDSVEVGQIVDAIGKIREWNGEIYMIPEVVCPVDPNMELLRKVEIAAKIKEMPSKEEVQEDKEDLRTKILNSIGKEKDGISYDALLKEAGADEEASEKVINDLLAEGVCYEPTPGKIKKI